MSWGLRASLHHLPSSSFACTCGRLELTVRHRHLDRQHQLQGRWYPIRVVSVEADNRRQVDKGGYYRPISSATFAGSGGGQSSRYLGGEGAGGRPLLRQNVSQQKEQSLAVHKNPTRGVPDAPHPTAAMTLAPANDADFKVEDVQLDVKLDVDDAEAANAALERRKVVEKSLKRKLDARCSIFVLIYIMSTCPPRYAADNADYLDRNNIAAARLKGLQADLKLSDTQYATCLSILYAGYILMQVPSNMIVNRMSRPSIYIASAVSWGAGYVADAR